MLGLLVTAAAVATVGDGQRSAGVAKVRAPASRSELAVAEAASQGASTVRELAARTEPRSATTVAEGVPPAERDAAATAMPWLHNFAATAVAGIATPGVVERMAQWRAPDASCIAAAYEGLAITADVAGTRGAEEVLASYTQGVLVLDAGGRLLASAAAPACQGSADDIEALAAGDAQIDGPVIALAVTSGGHRVSSTWLVLYRVLGGVVEPVWSGAVEEHDGERTRSGEVTLLPGALVYRTPSGNQTLWTYSAEHARYTELALVVPPGV